MELVATKRLSPTAGPANSEDSTPTNASYSNTSLSQMLKAGTALFLGGGKAAKATYSQEASLVTALDVTPTASQHPTL